MIPWCFVWATNHFWIFEAKYNTQTCRKYGTHRNDCGHLVKHLSVKIAPCCCITGPLLCSWTSFILKPPLQRHNACRSSHSMPAVVCILISHESQSCCFFNKLPLLPRSHCFHYCTCSKQSSVRYAAGLFEIEKKYKTKKKNIFSWCTNTAKILHVMINVELL